MSSDMTQVSTLQWDNWIWSEFIWQGAKCAGSRVIRASISHSRLQ